jgi:hypothetical protein
VRPVVLLAAFLIAAGFVPAASGRPTPRGSGAVRDRLPWSVRHALPAVTSDGGAGQVPDLPRFRSRRCAPAGDRVSAEAHAAERAAMSRATTRVSPVAARHLFSSAMTGWQRRAGAAA